MTQCHFNLNLDVLHIVGELFLKIFLNLFILLESQKYRDGGETEIFLVLVRFPDGHNS